jgi:hypothetical protein
LEDKITVSFSQGIFRGAAAAVLRFLTLFCLIMSYICFLGMGILRLAKLKKGG